MTDPNDGGQFARLPATDADRSVEGRPTRAAVREFFTERYGIAEETLAPYTCWEKGKGKIWLFRGRTSDPIAIEALGMLALRTRQRHWKPTTNIAQVLGSTASRNVIDLDESQARAFWAGEDQAVSWTGDPGYLIVRTTLADRRVPLGVGLYLDGELRSMIPKSHREALQPFHQVD